MNYNADFKIAVGARLRALRQQYGLSQTTVAEKIGIRYQTYQNYEYGRRELPVHSCILLAQLYDVSMDYLCLLSDSPTPYTTQP